MVSNYGMCHLSASRHIAGSGGSNPLAGAIFLFMKYGINYQGSKNRIVRDMCALFPKRENFYDLFAGGCAVTHRMLELGHFGHYYFSDINPMPVNLFYDCIRGHKPEPRWVSHEEFSRVKYTDAYAACCFSFGGDWNTYAYSKEVEPIKEALHYAVVYRDFERSDKLGIDLHLLEWYETYMERYRALKKALNMNRTEECSNIERLSNLERLTNLCGVESLTRNNVLERMTNLCGVESRSVSYDQVEIKPNSVVYNDIPYKSTSRYISGRFDYDKFYDWCRHQTELTFISEYNMPDDFICIHEFTRLDSRAAKCTKKVVERLFIPKHQVGIYNESKTTLF